MRLAPLPSLVLASTLLFAGAASAASSTSAPPATTKASQALASAERAEAERRALATPIYALREAIQDAKPEARAALLDRVSALQARGRQLLDLVITRYERVAEDPSLHADPARVEAIFRAAKALRERGDREDATRRYEQLLREAPASHHAGDALASLGEIAFEQGRFEEAVALCQRAGAASPKDPELRARALYMESWAARSLGETRIPQAMTALRGVVALSSRAPRSARLIAPSAERELVDLYARHGRREAAASFFEPLDPRTRQRLLADLQARYRSIEDEAISL